MLLNQRGVDAAAAGCHRDGYLVGMLGKERRAVGVAVGQHMRGVRRPQRLCQRRLERTDLEHAAGGGMAGLGTVLL